MLRFSSLSIQCNQMLKLKFGIIFVIWALYVGCLGKHYIITLSYTFTLYTYWEIIQNYFWRPHRILNRHQMCIHPPPLREPVFQAFGIPENKLLILPKICLQLEWKQLHDEYKFDWIKQLFINKLIALGFSLFVS